VEILGPGAGDWGGCGGERLEVGSPSLGDHPCTQGKPPAHHSPTQLVHAPGQQGRDSFGDDQRETACTGVGPEEKSRKKKNPRVTPEGLPDCMELVDGKKKTRRELTKGGGHDGLIQRKTGEERPRGNNLKKAERVSLQKKKQW